MKQGRSVAIKKITNFLTGLPFAIVLLILIALYSVIGTILPQGMASDYYLSRYPQFAPLILAFQLNKSYSSIIFFILLALFTLNLIGCTLKVLPAQIRRSKADYQAQASPSAEELYSDNVDFDELEKSLIKNGFAISKAEQGYTAFKHRFGNLGSSFTHLGIVVIILGAIIGALFADEGYINLLPGDARSFEEYNFALRLDDFYLEFRETGQVEQYYSEVTIIRPNQDDKKATLWVNNPLAVKPLNFYQTSYGWAGPLQITNAEGEVVLAKLLRRGEDVFFTDEHLSVYLYGFYPNFTLTSQGEPLTMTEELKNPQYAVILYEFGQHVGSYILEPYQGVQYKDYEIAFGDARLYTGLTYRKDFGYAFVLLGSLIMISGLIMSFYFYPKNIIVKADSIKIASGKNSWGLNFKIKKIISELEKGDKN